MSYNMEQTFRWYGPKDPVPLAFVRQTGATGVVSSLHHIPYGEVWTVEEIEKHKKLIEDAGLTWSVVESLPCMRTSRPAAAVAKSISKTTRFRWKISAGAASASSPTTSCRCWTGSAPTSAYRLPDGSEALYFNQAQFAAFEIFILKRKGARKGVYAGKGRRSEGVPET